MSLFNKGILRASKRDKVDLYTLELPLYNITFTIYVVCLLKNSILIIFEKCDLDIKIYTSYNIIFVLKYLSNVFRFPTWLVLQEYSLVL